MFPADGSGFCQGGKTDREAEGEKKKRGFESKRLCGGDAKYPGTPDGDETAMTRFFFFDCDAVFKPY